MGEDNGSRKQTRPEPGATIRHTEDQKGQGLYMDAYQDYSSLRRKIVKSARKWSATINKPKKFRLSADTNQNTTPAGSFVKTPTSQVCKEEKLFKLDIAGNVQARTINGVFIFGSAARKVIETKTSLPALQ